MIRGDNTLDMYTSSWMKMQLRAMAAKEIVKLEAIILAELDHIVYRPGGVGKDNVLALWVCLWVLILTYRAYFSFLFVHPSHEKSRKLKS